MLHPYHGVFFSIGAVLDMCYKNTGKRSLYHGMLKILSKNNGYAAVKVDGTLTMYRFIMFYISPVLTYLFFGGAVPCTLIVG